MVFLTFTHGSQQSRDQGEHVRRALQRETCLISAHLRGELLRQGLSILKWTGACGRGMVCFAESWPSTRQQVLGEWFHQGREKRTHSVMEVPSCLDREVMNVISRR